MQVKKKNPNWYPSEKKDLKVGEVIEITDPRALVLNGDVTPLDEDGAEVSAFELYGVVVKDEMKEFEEYLKMKKQEAMKTKLEEEKAALESQIKAQEAAKVAEAPVEATAPAKKK